MTVAELLELRQAMGSTQTDMARGIGLSLRAYQDIENGEGALRRRHQLAIERYALDEAVGNGNPMLAPADVRRSALRFAFMLLYGDPLGADMR